MALEKLSIAQQEMLFQAQKVVDEASADYIEMLKQHIQELKKSLLSNDITSAMLSCYRIQSQAGTFGWHLAGEISGWFKRLLIKQQETGLNSTVNMLFMDSFATIINDNLKANSDAAVQLLLHIETELKKQDIR